MGNIFWQLFMLNKVECYLIIVIVSCGVNRLLFYLTDQENCHHYNYTVLVMVTGVTRHFGPKTLVPKCVGSEVKIK